MIIVTEYMSKTHSDSYIPMHRLMYSSQGVSLQRKGNVRRFNGFNFEEDSKLYSSKLTSIKLVFVIYLWIPYMYNKSVRFFRQINDILPLEIALSLNYLPG